MFEAMQADTCVSNFDGNQCLTSTRGRRGATHGASGASSPQKTGSSVRRGPVERVSDKFQGILDTHPGVAQRGERGRTGEPEHGGRCPIDDERVSGDAGKQNSSICCRYAASLARAGASPCSARKVANQRRAPTPVSQGGTRTQCPHRSRERDGEIA